MTTSDPQANRELSIFTHQADEFEIIPTISRGLLNILNNENNKEAPYLFVPWDNTSQLKSRLLC